MLVIWWSSSSLTRPRLADHLVPPVDVDELGHKQLELAHHEIDEVAVGHLVGAITFGVLYRVKIFILVEHPLMSQQVEGVEVEG